MDLTQWGVWLAGAVAVVGGIEWIKGFWKKVPTVVLSFAMPVLAVGVAFALGGEHPLWDAAGIAALSELGFGLIVKKVKEGLKK